MINLNYEQQLIAECAVELTRQLVAESEYKEFLERFEPAGMDFFKTNEWLSTIAIMIENNIKLAGGWEVVNVSYDDFISRVVLYIFHTMHNYSELDKAFLIDINRYVQAVIDENLYKEEE